MSILSIRRAILSVSDKRGLVEFARALGEREVQILATGGTGRAIAEAGIAMTKVSEYTGANEILGGRVKTLHPMIHGGILAADSEEHRTELEAEGIGEIDLVAVNLYPFEDTVAKDGVTLADAVENIDIGGPTMVRAAAKNFDRTVVVVDPADYDGIIAEIGELGGVSRATRRRLARKAFAHTAGYDAAITAYLTSLPQADGEADDDTRADFPEVITLQWDKVLDLRYGENPHQKAAFYRDSKLPLPLAGARSGLGDADVLQGKALSYNNILDLDAALSCCLEFDSTTAVVVKHTNPCGVACADSVSEAYRQARATDPTSSFGGIVAVNAEVDAALAAQLVETFLECVVAPSYSAEARELLAKKKNLRLVALPGLIERSDTTTLSLRSVTGGLLAQSSDRQIKPATKWDVVTKRKPSGAELAALEFAWRVAKHVKSNAIVYAKNGYTVGIGAGQMSRVDAAKLAVMKSEASLEGAVVASDAFYPFRDGVDAAAKAGATAVVQPGGSIRDAEVIAAADEHGMAMMFTAMRHFRH